MVIYTDTETDEYISAGEVHLTRVAALIVGMLTIAAIGLLKF